MKWSSFWDCFVVDVHSKDKDSVIKFSYLTACFKGEAAEAIDGLVSTSTHFKDAVDILQKRFGWKSLLSLMYKPF